MSAERIYNWKFSDYAIWRSLRARKMTPHAHLFSQNDQNSPQNPVYLDRFSPNLSKGAV